MSTQNVCSIWLCQHCRSMSGDAEQAKQELNRHMVVSQLEADVLVIRIVLEMMIGLMS